MSETGLFPTRCHAQHGCIRAFEDETCGNEGQCTVFLAVQAERQRWLDLVEEVRTSPQWSGRSADWICGAIVDWSNEAIDPAILPDPPTPAQPKPAE